MSVKGIDFIGLGAQKSATSWVYACLYEHPQICAPIKEIHFFSRERFAKGREWYESHFTRCKNDLRKGEFSTSYLYSKEAPERIKHLYPDAKLIAILRNPIDRAVSQYKNALKAGEIDKFVTFESYIKEEKSVLEQGYYYEQLTRYFEHFNRSQLLILIQEDIKKDPQKFISSVYAFLEVAPGFVPSMLHTKINVARVPKSIGVERTMHIIAESLRKVGFDRFVHLIRKLGLPDLIRNVNTKDSQEKKQYELRDKQTLANYFFEDVAKLSKLLHRDLTTEWNIKIL